MAERDWGSDSGRGADSPGGSPVAITGNIVTGGYWILNAKGGVTGFHSPWYGSLAGTTLTSPPTAIAGV
jgi:hypothetical protein